MKQTFLCNREDIRQVESEEKYEFTRYVLNKLGVPVGDELPEDYASYTVQHKVRLRKLLDTFDVAVVDDRDGGIMIYVKETLVAEWKKCLFDLHVDLTVKDPAKRIYAKMHADWWSIFDGEEPHDE